jgi:hypothetical protein
VLAIVPRNQHRAGRRIQTERSRNIVECARLANLRAGQIASRSGILIELKPSAPNLMRLPSKSGLCRERVVCISSRSRE